MLTFPAVTVCNVNSFRSQELEKRNLTNLIRFATVYKDEENTNICNEELESVSHSENLNHLTYEELSIKSRQHVDEFIVDCYFAGEPCGNVTEIFEPIFTGLGICYIFNSGKIKRLLQSKGTGQREGLRLLVNVNQSNYATPDDAGVKIAIHSQSEPPMPDDQGIGVPPGRNAFISIKQKSIDDKTGRSCKRDTSSLNFLQGEYSTYSESACLVDCIHSSIADSCGCIGARSFYSPDTPRYSQLPNCTLEKVCCLVNELFSPSECNCPAACSSTTYKKLVSYSLFPAEYIFQGLFSSFGIPMNFFSANFLEVSVYFETLNVESQTTSSAYSFVALLSDIGGQLGLFLGVSTISLMEFGTWVVDEIKNRVFGISEEKMKGVCFRKSSKYYYYGNSSQQCHPNHESGELKTTHKMDLSNIV